MKQVIAWVERPPIPSGSGPFAWPLLRLVGLYYSSWEYEETVARLVAASEQGVNPVDDYKTSVTFSGTFRGDPFRLYDWKGDRLLHVGGSRRFNLRGFQDALTRVLAAVEPSPYAAHEKFDRLRTYGWPLRSVGVGSASIQ